MVWGFSVGGVWPPSPGPACLHLCGKDRVVAEYSDKLGAYDEPVPFDDATADALKSAATVLSGTLTSQAASRSGWASAASTDFEGHYADVFDTNAKTASTDCTNIASALDDLVAEVQKLKEAAQAERARRKQAKEWADRQDKENIFKKGWDWVSNGDKPPAGPAQVPLPQPHEVTTTPWSEPAPAARGRCPRRGRTTCARTRRT